MLYYLTTDRIEVIFISCYHPLLAYRKKFDVGTVPHILHLGKDFISDKTQYEWLSSEVYDVWQIPCGKCVGCRLAYSREWANRCYLESLTKGPNWFVTLTYNDENLPSEIFFKDNGELFTVNSLNKDDLSAFIKRLRSYYDYHDIKNNMSFYACGEYGSNFFRPHYHLLLFGLPIDDLVYHSTKNGFVTYNSPTFDKLWNKGFVTINEFSWETAAYVARYMLKKQKGEDFEDYQKLHLVPEFVNMSRVPGIAYNYYSANKEKIFSDGYISVKNSKGVFHDNIPKYFYRLLENEDYDLFLKLKQERKDKCFSDYERNAIFNTSDLSNYEQRLIDENTKLSQIKALRRDFESSHNIL